MIVYLTIIIPVMVLLYYFFLYLYCRYMKEKEGKKNVSAGNLTDKTINTIKPKKFKKLRDFKGFLVIHFLYGLMRYSLLKTCKIPSFFLRKWLLRRVFLADITDDTVIYGGNEIRSPWNFKAGNCVVANNCILDARNGIVFEDNVVLGGGVHIWTEEHDVNDPYFGISEKNRGSVIVEKHAWICSDSTILPGVHVGEGAVLASRAVATKDLEPFGIYAGVPAKKIGERNKDLRYVLSGKPHYYFY